MTRPGDVIAGGASGMGPGPPPQHQQPADVSSGYKFVYNIYIYIMYIQYIFYVYNKSLTKVH